MAAFLYHAVDAEGRAKKGVIEAANATAARQSLRAQTLLPVSVEATTQKARGGGAGWRAPTLKGRALTLVTRQLATLIGSGVSIEEALGIAARQAGKPGTATLLLNVRDGVLGGSTFAEALGSYPVAFPDFYRASIAAGEKSGQLGTVMQHLAGFVERRQKNRQTVGLALLYPALLAVVSLGIIVMLLTYVVPDIVRVFTARGADLPLLTRGLIAASGFVSAYGWMMVAGLAAGALLFRQWLKPASNRLRWDRWKLRFPLTRGIVRQSNTAQFAGTLAMLVQSGVPLSEALEGAARVTPNSHIRSRIEETERRVREGSGFGDALAAADVFPPMLLAMVASGEAGRQLGPTLERTAADQQGELDALVATVVALVEPGVLLLMGGLVLLMVMSILLPIVGLNDLAGGGL